MGPVKKRKPREPRNTTVQTPGIEVGSIQTEDDNIHVSGVTSGPVNGAPAPPTQVPVKEKVIVTLDANGGLDLEGMREKTKEKLIAALKRSQSGLLPPMPESPVKRWPEFAVRGLYGLLGAAETAAAARKFPMEIAQAAFMYDDAEMAVLMEPTQAVLAKHGGRLDRWQEEVALGMVLVQVHFGKMHKVRMLMMEYEARRAAEVKTPAAAPDDSKAPPIEGMPN